MKLVKSMDFLDKDKYLSKAIMSSAPQKSEWTLNGLKLVYLVASMLSDYRYFVDRKSNVDSFTHNEIKKHLSKVPRSYEISRYDFIELTGISVSHAAREIKKACEDVLLKLMTTPNPFDINNANSFEMNQWFSKARYNDDKGVIEIIVHEDALPYFVVLVDYTKLNYAYIGSLKSAYAVRTYLICKVLQNRYNPQVSMLFDLEEFKSKIGLSGKYNNIPIFRQRVLDVVKKEISDKTDIIFEYNLEKVGRSFKNIELHISQKKSIPKILENNIIDSVSIGCSQGNTKELNTDFDDIKSTNTLVDDKIFVLLRSYGINEKKALWLIESHGNEACESGVEKLLLEIGKGNPINNVSGYLIKCIENGVNDVNSENIKKSLNEKELAKQQKEEEKQNQISDINSYISKNESGIVVLCSRYEKNEKLYNEEEIELVEALKELIDKNHTIKNELSYFGIMFNGHLLSYQMLENVLKKLEIADNNSRISKLKNELLEKKNELASAKSPFKEMLENEINLISMKIANLV